MGQIVKTKKKGRPSKVDLARCRDAAVDTPEKELRRSGRRRNVKYTFDFDDYLDDDEYFVEQDEEEEEEDERGKEKKKLKHLLKLQQSKEEEVDDIESTPSRTHRGPTTSASSSSDDEKKPSKKRKIEADYEQSEDELVNDNDNDVDEGRARNGEAKCVDSAPGTPSETPTGIRLPDKKKLDLIIDKLQKKDIYGVYAEPVDPEELPDYHEVIENPMDFATLRNKLANGSYSTLEQFESDVLLICANAMQYNAPDTIYYKQARSIQELAKKKFEKLRVNYECSEKDVKLDQKTKYGSVVRKQIKKTMVRMFQEPVGSDFSSGATARDNQILNSAAYAGALEKPCSADGHAEGNASLIDHNLDKAEESLPGKGPLSRIGRKASVHDENRRATYDLSTQPVSSTESIFSTFEDETKQLVTVGVYSDHAYARSLARFAASLGPVAWRVASQNIEQALPPGFKFGRGWVGEYEPLPTPVLMLENYTMKEPAFFSKFKHTFGAQKNEKTSEDPIAPKDKPLSTPIFEGKSPYFGSTSDKPTESCLNISTKKQSPREVNIEERPSFLTSVKKPPSHSYQHQTLQSRNFNESEKKLMMQVETNCPPLPNQRNSETKSQSQISTTAEIPGSRSIQASPRNRSLLTSRSFKQPSMNGIAVAGLPNGKSVNNSDITAVASLASDGVPTMAKASDFFPQEQEHGLSDPVQLMRLLAEKAQNQRNCLKQSQIDASPISPATPSLKKDDSGNAAVAAARAWMSIGAGGVRQDGETTNQPNSHISAESLYNPSRDVQQQILRFRGELPSAVHFQSNSSPLHAFASRPARVGNEAQLQYRPMIFPQLVSTDLSRFQVQSPWQSLNQPAQPRQKLESLPPDLNISFQSSGSPGQPSPGVLVDSQQPDLALQL